MSLFFFFGALLAFAIVSYLIWDSERRKERVGHLAARLEHLSKGSEKFKIRHLRRLNLSAFFHDRVLNEMDRKIVELECDNGLETPPPVEGVRRFSRKLERMEERMARPEEVMGQSRQS